MNCTKLSIWAWIIILSGLSIVIAVIGTSIWKLNKSKNSLDKQKNMNSLLKNQ